MGLRDILRRCADEAGKTGDDRLDQRLKVVPEEAVGIGLHTRPHGVGRIHHRIWHCAVRTLVEVDIRGIEGEQREQRAPEGEGRCHGVEHLN